MLEDQAATALRRGRVGVTAIALVASLATCGALVSCAGVKVERVPVPGRSYVAVGVDASAKPVAVINKALIGVNGPGPTASYALMRKVGVHWVRTDVSFEATDQGRPVYDCASGAWDPAVLDGRVAGIRQEGGTPLEIVDYSPACLTADPTSPRAGNSPPDVGTNQAKWEALVKQMAVHEIEEEGVRYFEVWNEPDWLFFGGGLAGYLQLYADTARALEAAAGQAGARIFVGGPALADVLDEQNMGWLEPLLAYVSANQLPLDFITWHSYANDPYSGPNQPGGAPLCLGRAAGPGANPCYYNPNLDEATIAKEVRQTKQALVSYPALHPLLIVDEWNIDGEGDPRQDQPYGAAYAAAVLDSAQRAELDGMCFFDDTDSLSNPEANWGMLSASYQPKPVYQTFLYWKDLASDQVPLSIVPKVASASNPVEATANNDATGRIGGVAATSRGGAITILLYDFKPFDSSGDYGTADPTPYDHQVMLTLSELHGTRYDFSRLLTDGHHHDVEVAHGLLTPGGNGDIRLDFRLAGEGVTLITLEPQG